MQIYVNALNDFSGYIPVILSVFAFLWAGFALNDYLYEQNYCKYFNILPFLKKEYKAAFHPKYLYISVTYYVVIVTWLYVLHQLELEHNYLQLLNNYKDEIVWGIVISIPFLFSICTYIYSKVKRVSWRKLFRMKLGKIPYDSVEYKKLLKFNWLSIKVFVIVVEILTYSLYSIFNMIEHPMGVAIVSLFGSIFFYGWLNDSYGPIFRFFFNIEKEITYSMDYISIIKEGNNTFYGVLIPSNRVSNEKIVSCRVYFFKTEYGITYAIFNTNEIKLFENDQDIELQRYEPDHIGRYLDNTFFDGIDMKRFNQKMKVAYKVKYYFDGIWKTIK